MVVVIRRIRRDEGPAFRAIRLQALAESPLAFGSTLAETEARPAAYWDYRARDGAVGGENVLFIAEEGGQLIGVVGGYVDDSRATRSVDLVSMWVNPECRGQGVGRRLIECVAAWAEEMNAQRVVLWVTAGNEPAIALYHRYGFRETRAVQPHPSQPDLYEEEMVLDLCRPAGESPGG